MPIRAIGGGLVAHVAAIAAMILIAAAIFFLR